MGQQNQNDPHKKMGQQSQNIPASRIPIKSPASSSRAVARSPASSSRTTSASSSRSRISRTGKAPHHPEKWTPVFRSDDAQISGLTLRKAPPFGGAFF